MVRYLIIPVPVRGVIIPEIRSYYQDHVGDVVFAVGYSDYRCRVGILRDNPTPGYEIGHDQSLAVRSKHLVFTTDMHSR